MENLQLILFEESQEEINRRELGTIKKQLDNVRKGLFARHTELAKKYMELYYEFEDLKRELCKYKNQEEKDTGSCKEKVVMFNFG